MKRIDETYLIFGNFLEFKAEPKITMDLFSIFIQFNMQPTSVQVLNIANPTLPILITQFKKEDGSSITFYPDKNEMIFSGTTLSCDSDEAFINFSQMINSLMEKYQLSSNRLAYNVKYVAEEIDASKYLSDNDEFEIKDLVEWNSYKVKRKKLSNETVNVIESISYNEDGLMINGDNKVDAIIGYDINTHQSNQNFRFNKENIIEIFEGLRDLIPSIK